MTEQTSAAGDVWAAAFERLAMTARRLDGDGFATLDGATGVGARHFGRLAALALREQLDFADANWPRFVRYEEPWSQWGAPNADNVYHRSAVDPSGHYRVSLDVTGVRDVIISQADGDMHEGHRGVFHERSLDELPVTGGRLEVTLGGPGADLEIHPDARILMVRQYQLDWARDAVAGPFIERLDLEQWGPANPSLADLQRQLQRATDWVDAALVGWNDYSMLAAGALPANEPQPPSKPPGGADNIAYGACRWQLAPGEALLLETSLPDSDRWSIQCHFPHWFDSGEFADRFTSLNSTTAHVDDDGLLRVVISAEPPGTPNWLDTTGVADGLLVYRWVLAEVHPTPTARVVAVDDLAGQLPETHPTESESERRARLTERRRLAAERYR